MGEGGRTRREREREKENEVGGDCGMHGRGGKEGGGEGGREQWRVMSLSYWGVTTSRQVRYHAVMSLLYKWLNPSHISCRLPWLLHCVYGWKRRESDWGTRSMGYYMSNIKLSMQHRNLASQPGPPPSFWSLAVHSDDQRRQWKWDYQKPIKCNLDWKNSFHSKQSKIYRGCNLYGCLWEKEEER